MIEVSLDHPDLPLVMKEIVGKLNTILSNDISFYAEKLMFASRFLVPISEVQKCQNLDLPVKFSDFNDDYKFLSFIDLLKGIIDTDRFRIYITYENEQPPYGKITKLSIFDMNGV